MAEEAEITGQIVVNKLSFWGLIENYFKRRRLSKHKKPITKEMLEESAKVKALTRSRDAIEIVNEKLYAQVVMLSDQIGSTSTSMEEKLLDGVIKMFSGSPKPVNSSVALTEPPLVETQKTLDTGIDKTDDEILEFLSNSSAAEKGLLKSKSVSEISKLLNSSGANISDKTIIRSKELLEKDGTKQ